MQGRYLRGPLAGWLSAGISLPKERNRQARAVAWEDTSVDEVVPEDGELEEEPLVDKESLEPSDKIENPGGERTTSRQMSSQAEAQGHLKRTLS